MEHPGTANKTGFETMFMSAGASYQVPAAALDVRGLSLGRCEVCKVELPQSWTESVLRVHDATSAEDTLVTELDEQTSSSQDFSTPLHHRPDQAEDAQDPNKSRFDVADLRDLVFLISVLTMALFATVFVAVRSRHRRSLSRLDTWKYKAVESEA